MDFSLTNAQKIDLIVVALPVVLKQGMNPDQPPEVDDIKKALLITIEGIANALYECRNEA